MNSSSSMSTEALQMCASPYPNYRNPSSAPASVHADTVGKLWNMRLVPMLANSATSGRFSGAALSCPVRACAGFGEMAPGAASHSYVNVDAIENIFCLEGKIEVHFGTELENTVTLGRFDMFSIPANVRHCIKNASTEVGRLVTVLSSGPDSSYPAVFDAATVVEDLPAEALQALGVRVGDACGEPVDVEKVLARVTRFTGLVPYKAALKSTAGIPPEATAMLSANSVSPLIVPEGHVGRSRTAPIYGMPGLYISIAECTSGDDGPPPHSHSDTQENFFVLDGIWDITSGFNNEFLVEAKPYDLFAMPPKIMRSFRNKGTGNARLFVIIMGPDKMNDIVSFPKAVGQEVERRFGKEAVEALERVRMTFDAEERLRA